MRSPYRRLLPLAAAFVLVTTVVTGCGSDSSTSSAPATTKAAPTSSPGAACDDVKQIRQANDDLKAAVTNKDLSAGQTAWASMTAAVSSLGATAKATGSAASQAVVDLLAPITSNFSTLDTMGKLSAVVAALSALGTGLTNAFDGARRSLNCPD